MDRYPDGGGGREIYIDKPGHPSREIDLLAEDAALAALQEMGLGWSVLSEERGFLPGEAGSTLILDPIDGTYNAIHGIPLFSVSLALATGERDEITSAVVTNIPLGKSFTAVRGQGAYYNGNVIRTRMFDKAEAVFNSFLGPATLNENRLLFSWPYRGRYFGSISLEVCYVAKGSIDLFTLFYRIPRITDIAGAYLVLKEAGGMMYLRGEGAEWSEYVPAKCNPEGKDFMVVGDPSSLDRMREAVSNLNPNIAGVII